jgi:hypothetical protein
MGLIVKPNEVIKGVSNEIKINKQELINNIPETNAFKNTDIWKKIMLTYRTVELKQVQHIIFETEEDSEGFLLSNFFVTTTGNNNWQINSLTIFDLDGGYFKLQRNNLINIDNTLDIIIE